MSHTWVRVTLPDTKFTHIIPQDDRPSHSVHNCPCGTRIHHDRYTRITVHNAWDGERHQLYTYETGIDEPIHPDPKVAARFREENISDCPNGCKIYSDPLSDVLVLAHNWNYGCKIKKEDL